MNHQESDLENQQLQTRYFHLPGIRFHPSDFELVRFYLLAKIQGNLDPLITQLLVRDCDLFASQEPWQIWDNFSATSPYLDNTDLYFFTDLKLRSKNSTHFQRKVGCGTWHGEDGIARAHQFEVNIDKDHSFMAYRKRFTYKNKGSDQNGCWIMYEYSLPSLSKTKVLCQLRNNNNNNNNKESEVESKKRKRAKCVTTKQRKRVAASSSTTKEDVAYDVTTDLTSNVSEAVIAFNCNGTVSKGLGNEPIVQKDLKYVDGAEPDHVNDDDSYSIDIDDLFAGVEGYSDPGEVVQGEPAAGYDGNPACSASEGLAEYNGDEPVLSKGLEDDHVQENDQELQMGHANGAAADVIGDAGELLDSSDEPVSKDLEDDHVQQKDQELQMGHANGASTDHVNGDSGELFDLSEVDSWIAYDDEFGNSVAVVQDQVASGYDWDTVMPSVDTSVTANLEAFDLVVTSTSSSVDHQSPGYDSLSQSFIKAYPRCWVQENAIHMIPSPLFKDKY